MCACVCPQRACSNRTVYKSIQFKSCKCERTYAAYMLEPSTLMPGEALVPCARKGIAGSECRRFGWPSAAGQYRLSARAAMAGAKSSLSLSLGGAYIHDVVNRVVHKTLLSFENRAAAVCVCLNSDQRTTFSPSCAGESISRLPGEASQSKSVGSHPKNIRVILKHLCLSGRVLYRL